MKTTLSFFILALAATPAAAQITGGVYAPARLKSQATVSSDNRYVTITARPSVSRLIAVQEFAFQKSANGRVVGSVGGENARNHSILDRPGMTRLGNP